MECKLEKIILSVANTCMIGVLLLLLIMAIKSVVLDTIQEDVTFNYQAFPYELSDKDIQILNTDSIIYSCSNDDIQIMEEYYYNCIGIINEINTCLSDSIRLFCTYQMRETYFKGDTL